MIYNLSFSNKVSVLMKGIIVLLIFISGGLFSQSVCTAQSDSTRILSIPLSEIATSAVTDLQLTRDLLIQKVQINTSYVLIPQIDKIQEQVNELQNLSDQILGTNLKFSFYSSLLLRWDRINTEIDPTQELLKKYSAELEGILGDLQREKNKWEITYDETEPEALTDDIANRIISISSYIDSASLIVRDSLKSSIGLQNRITDLALVSQSYHDNILELQLVELGALVISHNEPIWSVQRETDSTKMASNPVSLLAFGMEDSKLFLSDRVESLILLGISFLLLTALLYWLNRVHKNVNKETDDVHAGIRDYIISRPLIVAFMFTMLLALWWLPQKPILLREIYSVLFILPFLPIFYHMVHRSIRHSLVILFVIFIFLSINEYLHLGPIYARVSTLFESLALIAFHIWFLKNRQKLKLDDSKDNLLYRFLFFIQPILFFLSVVAFLGNVFGYYYLSELLNSGVLLSLLLLILFSTGLSCLVTVIYFFFQSSAADKVLLLKTRKDIIYEWLFKKLRMATIVLWMYYMLRSFYLWTPFMKGATQLWQTGYEFGSVVISVGGIINFVLIIYLSWVISFSIKIFLEIEIFERLNMPRGVPMAISSLTQYFLFFLGFMIALAAAGINLQNLSLLAGALGVGIGFGLQNIVNNFISGLILAFERPVTAGDIIDVGGHEGEVKKIGIRASIIKQWDGSEVLVPNAELISNKVINWTLAKYTRRMILTVQTHLDTDPDLVLKVIKQAAYKVEFVLHTPEAKAYFQGVKDKQMEFALFYWASGNILDCKSDVNLEVQKSLRESGINLVMPVSIKIQEEKRENIEVS